MSSPSNTMRHCVYLIWILSLNTQQSLHQLRVHLFMYVFSQTTSFFIVLLAYNVTSVGSRRPTVINGSMWQPFEMVVL